MAAAFHDERARSGLGAQELLRRFSPAWNLVGRVHFNLAENRKDDEAPFAFIATYTSRLSAHGKAQHLPLGHALGEYAGEAKRERLLSLLLPVQCAGETCPWSRSMSATRSQVVFSRSSAWGVLRPQPRWSKSTTRQARGRSSAGSRDRGRPRGRRGERRPSSPSGCRPPRSTECGEGRPRAIPSRTARRAGRGSSWQERVYSRSSPSRWARRRPPGPGPGLESCRAPLRIGFGLELEVVRLVHKGRRIQVGSAQVFIDR